MADDFGAVADAFERNFTELGELGAAFSLYVDGEVKADLWAGVADKTTGQPWSHDTLQLVYSTTKGAAAVCVARLVEAGRISYGDTVATYWPEFAASGKGEVTIAQMMSHQAGLPYATAELSFDDLMAVTPVVEALAAQDTDLDFDHVEPAGVPRGVVELQPFEHPAGFVRREGIVDRARRMG